MTTTQPTATFAFLSIPERRRYMELIERRSSPLLEGLTDLEEFEFQMLQAKRCRGQR